MSIEYLKIIINHMGDPVFVQDQQHRFVFVNDAACKLFGRTREQLLKKTDYELFPKEQVDIFRKYNNYVFETGEKNINEELLTDSQGNVRIIATKKALYLNKTGRKYIIGSIRDITESKRSEEALRTSQIQLSEAMDIASIVYWEVDPIDYMFVLNDSFYTLYGTNVEQERGYRVTAEDFLKRFVHPDDHSFFYRFVEQNISRPGSDFVADIEHRVIIHDEEVRYTLARVRIVRDDSGRIVRIYGANQDITERKRMEEEVLRAHKLESLGILAGGIAHDFNNLMAVVMGNVQLAMMKLPEHHEIYPLLKNALQSTERTRDLTHRLLTFSKGGFPVKHISNVSEVLREIIQKTVKQTNIQVTFDVGENLWSVNVDEDQIRQLFYNLAINAVEAMPEGGTLIIQACNVEMQSLDSLPLTEGKYLMIVFTDSGMGIAEENLVRIFDPYFTTKDMSNQKGMGLGLSVCYSVLKKHDGHIAVASQQRKGTTFTMYLPVLVRKDHEQQI